ncbi:NAD(+) diphosphatase [Thioclava sp. BHET1]|nr:NAD(+) diphosphatase [Thioclava sp. BHET1]
MSDQSHTLPIDLEQAPAFAGISGLERRAELRRDTARLGALRELAQTRILPLWWGRPLICETGLGLLAHDHAFFAEQDGPEIFLGEAEGVFYFARDVSDFEPEGPAPDSTVFFDPSEQHHPSLPVSHVFSELRGAMARLDVLEAELAATARGMFEWHRLHGFCAACGSASEIADAGWVRVCPACKRHHFPRTDPVVIMLITKGNSLLLGRSPHWPEGMYSTLAGFMEPGETVEKAVRREVAEETGVVVGPVHFVTSQPWPFPSSLMLGCHGEALSTEITVDPEEIEDALWITRERLLEVVAGRDKVISPPRVGAIAGWLMRQWLADRLD